MKTKTKKQPDLIENLVSSSAFEELERLNTMLDSVYTKMQRIIELQPCIKGIARDGE